MSGCIHRLTRTRDNPIGGLDRLHPLDLPGTMYLDPGDFKWNDQVETTGGDDG
jgi:hypothetical protein